MMELKLIDEKRVGFYGNTFPHKDMIKAIAGSRWEAKQKCWSIPIEAVGQALTLFRGILRADAELVRKSLKYAEKAQRIKEIKEQQTPRLKGIKGLKANLYPYQALGVEFLDLLDEGEGAILAFDMGLGG